MELESDYDQRAPLPVYEAQAIQKYFQAETDSMAAAGYQNAANHQILRRNAVNVIYTNSKDGRSDAFTPYLAMNYFDRFISRHPLPGMEEDVNDRVILLAICCLSLAWKMRNKTFTFHEFLSKRDQLKVDQRKVLRMELKILNALSWRMRAVTAFCFVQYFFSIIPSFIFDRRVINEIIVQAQGDMKFTEFKPSVITAAAILTASTSLYGEGREHIEDRILTHRELDPEQLQRCVTEMIEMCVRKHIAVVKPQLKAELGKDSATEAARKPDRGKAPVTEAFPQPEPGKAPATQAAWKPSSSTSILEIEEVPDTSDQQEQVSEEDGSELNFDLKWRLYETEDLTIDPSLFPLEEDELTDEPDENVHPVPRANCCNLL